MRRWGGVLACTIAIVPLLVAAASGQALELDLRLKWFGTQASLPNHDFARQSSGPHAFADEFDLRLMLEADRGPLVFRAAHSTTLVHLEAAFRWPDDPSPPAEDDDRRLFDLTWRIDDDGHQQVLHRLDRLAVQYRSDDWSATLGREAVSWGNGIVFAPLDLFNPFAPTAVDRDYKPGDDLLLVERAFASGADVQLLAVGRRDSDGAASRSASSFAAKWRSPVGLNEYELVIASHYRDRVLGLGARGPIGAALWRTDLVLTELDDGGQAFSAVANLDYSLVVGERNLYVFSEYFRNGFGARRLLDSIVEYDAALLERLSRGELFSLLRNYLALGGRIEWNPLWRESVTLFTSLDDGSVLGQLQFDRDLGERQRIEFGVVHPFGGRGDEYGGIPLLDPTTTTGGSTRVYIRWAAYL